MTTRVIVMNVATMRDRIAADRPETWREHLHELIFEADTPTGKMFDIGLLMAIAASVAVVTLDSVDQFRDDHHTLLVTAEWVLTIAFTIEYVLRIMCVRNPLRYVFSFFGLVDLLSIVPTYVSLFVPGTESLVVIRSLRLLRVFRVFKLARFLTEASELRASIGAARAKLAVFMATVVISVVIVGAAMYVVEGPENGFTSVPVGMYWAVVTLTTVGYGDVTPQTPLGKMLAVAMMILGYSLIIVPTGIVSAEMALAQSGRITSQHCPRCSREGHDSDAVHCKFCGARL